MEVSLNRGVVAPNMSNKAYISSTREPTFVVSPKVPLDRLLRRPGSNTATTDRKALTLGSVMLTSTLGK